MADTVLKGHCLCGACTFELIGPHNFIGHCHCESCRRATASPFTTWIGQQNGRWAWTGTAPVPFESSAGNERGFCSTCGSPMYFRTDRFPNEVHFYAALLDDPNTVTPEAQYHADEILDWTHSALDQPKS
ncbi:GFA family protein [Planktotalea sp.]|uniref:GFA family protein n=1 Tax=Planktotalea sp. TaxID=2029877 RepID=UPI00329A0CCA